MIDPFELYYRIFDSLVGFVTVAINAYNFNHSENTWFSLSLIGFPLSLFTWELFDRDQIIIEHGFV